MLVLNQIISSIPFLKITICIEILTCVKQLKEDMIEVLESKEEKKRKMYNKIFKSYDLIIVNIVGNWILSYINNLNLKKSNIPVVLFLTAQQVNY